MNNGFVMPTVLAFILITSSIILFQSYSVLTELYSLQAAEDNLQDIEQLTNIKRSLTTIENGDKCQYQQLLTTDEYQVATNCIYVKTDNSSYNSWVQRIFTDDYISPQFFQQLSAYVGTATSEVEDDQVEIKLGANTIVSKYQQKYNLVIINRDTINQLLVVDNEQTIVVNSIVK